MSGEIRRRTAAHVEATVCGLALLALLLPALARAEPDRAALLVGRGDEVFARALTEKLTWQAIGFYREALKLDPRRYEALWRVARGHAWLAELLPDGERRAAMGKAGYDFATRAIAADPKRVEGHYYAARCIGEHGKGLGVFSALRQGIAGKYRRHLDDSLRIDRAFDGGGAHRLYGMYHNRLPWPMKSQKKAYQHLEQALRHGPHPLNHYCLAQVYLDDKRIEEARAQLRLCLKVDPRRSEPRAVAIYGRMCRRLLESL